MHTEPGFAHKVSEAPNPEGLKRKDSAEVYMHKHPRTSYKKVPRE